MWHTYEEFSSSADVHDDVEVGRVLVDIVQANDVQMIHCDPHTNETSESHTAEKHNKHAHEKMARCLAALCLPRSVLWSRTL